MDYLLTDDEVRVLGCLMEKEMATPDYYPLSLNGLKNGCNQKSNRNPVVSFNEETVLYALQGLKEQGLVRSSNTGRVVKHEQIFSNSIKIVRREEAIVAILLLRGPQTLGEIRSRTERLFNFSNLEEVQESIADLEDMKLVMKLPRQPGRKESRYGHLLSGQEQEELIISKPKSEPPEVIVRKERNDSDDLQEQIDILRQELEHLRQEFSSFKAEFED